MSSVSTSSFARTATATFVRERPLPSDWTVETGLQAFLAENGFAYDDYDRSWTPASLLGIRFSVPNTARHRWAIMLHDLHHIACGYGTDAVGEAEISAWELRRGIRPLGLYVGSIVVSGFLLGLVIAPRRTLRAWRQAGRRPSLYHRADHAHGALLGLTIGALRGLLELPRHGLAAHPRRVHSRAPKRSGHVGAGAGDRVDRGRCGNPSTR